MAMSSSATAADPRRRRPPQPNPIRSSRRVLILVTVVLGSTLYATTLLIASTLLPQMQGTMSATQDEIAWAMTFNILATAIVDADDRLAGGPLRPARDDDLVGLPASPSPPSCAAPPNSLETLVFWRDPAGRRSGAPVIPLSQTILLDSFPKRQQGLVTSIFGMAVVIGPVIGPTLGGMLSELYSWRWAFYMIVPVGVLSFVGPAPDPAARQAGRPHRRSTGPASCRCRSPSPASSSCCRAASASTGSSRPRS